VRVSLGAILMFIYIIIANKEEEITARQKKREEDFCCEIVLFAVILLFVPRGYSFCREVIHAVISFAVTVVGHRST